MYHGSEHRPQLKRKATLCSAHNRQGNTHTCHAQLAGEGERTRSHEQSSRGQAVALSHRGSSTRGSVGGGSSSQPPPALLQTSCTQGRLRRCSPHTCHHSPAPEVTAGHQGTSHGDGWSLLPLHPLTRLPPQHRGVTEGRQQPHCSYETFRE